MTVSLLARLVKGLKTASENRGYTCDGCGAELFDYPSRRICADCERGLEKNDRKTCAKCGRKTLAEGICLSCKSKLPRFTKGVSPLVYRAETASLVNRIKNGDRRLALFLGEQMTAAFLRAFPDIQTEFSGGKYALNAENAPAEAGALLVIPVPLTEEKRRVRGYNQAQELAETVVNGLQKRGVAAVLDGEALQKTRETAQQKHLGFAERAKNAVGAYRLHKRAIFRGKTVLLIDDILTTGATGSACARLLLNAGAARVIFLAAASLPERK